MSERPPPEPLARLEERLARARQEQAEARGTRRGGPEPPRGALGLGLRVGVELVAGLAVGLALGWVFDRLLGTRPWGLIVFFLLGAAAGMLNVFRLARQIVLGPTPPDGGETKR
jgi:ATP synthase protein I